MRAVRAKDTSPELSLRRELHGRGLRYRLHAKHLPGNPDIVFPGPRVAVFVDGDFWHGRVVEEEGEEGLRAQFRRNRSYWVPKILRTRERDRTATESLTQQGWTVIRLWESDIKADLPGCADRVTQAVRGEP